MLAGSAAENAAWLPDLDGDGIEIPGGEHWQVDPLVPTPVTAENTLANEWGAAPYCPTSRASPSRRFLG